MYTYISKINKTDTLGNFVSPWETPWICSLGAKISPDYTCHDAPDCSTHQDGALPSLTQLCIQCDVLYSGLGIPWWVIPTEMPEPHHWPHDSRSPNKYCTRKGQGLHPWDTSKRTKSRDSDACTPMFKHYSQLPKVKTIQVSICEWINKIYYSLTLNNTDLNCLGPFIREGNGTPLQYSCLENPMDGGAW